MAAAPVFASVGHNGLLQLANADSTNLSAAIKVLQKDQHQLLVRGDTKSAAAIGKDIDRMKDELKRRTDAAAAKTAAAAAAAGRSTTQAIKDKDLSASYYITVPVTNVINGRQVTSSLGRFQTTVLPGTQ